VRAGRRFAGRAGRLAAPRRASVALLVTILAAGVAAGQVRTQRAAAAVLPDTGAVTAYDDGGAFLLNGQPSFPIALSNPPPLDGKTPSGGDGLDEVVRSGVTMFRVGPLSEPWMASTIAYTEAWDQAALDRRVHTWVSLSNVSTARPGARSDLVLAKVVTALLSDRSAGGIGMWKGADEPGWGRTPPADLRFAYCRVTSRGPADWCAGEQPLDRNHLWVTIEAPRGAPSRLAGYSSVTDTHGVDVYPVSMTAADPDLHQVGTWTRALAAITPNRSVWTTLQICSSGSYDRAGDYIVPTRLQERYMIYDAIINGARGLSFFGGENPACWDLSDKETGWNWTFWNTTLAPLIKEIKARSPLGPVLRSPDSTRDLSTADPTTEAISRAVATPAGPQLWVIAARSGRGARPVTITGLPRTAKWASVYAENRAVRVVDGTLTDRFARWQVHVYRFAVSPAAARAD
jgi:hypothetical protein